MSFYSRIQSASFPDKAHSARAAAALTANKAAKIGNAPQSSKKDPTMPAAKFARAEKQNHTPIISDKCRAGASRATMDNPVGDRHNSPTVWKK